jgi:hypothetical protein
MKRTLELKLNKFDPIPDSLTNQSLPLLPDFKYVANLLEVDLYQLFHHLYLDSYGHNVPTPNPTNELYINMLTDDTKFCFKGGGLGINKEAKIGESNKFGKAFCRWFLYNHCSVSYFAHMDQILDKINPQFNYSNYWRLKRIDKGDTPDYFCFDINQHIPYIAEAKGTYDSISFKSNKFDDWRKQFKRVQLLDNKNRSYSVKGYIVATRFAAENHLRNKSQIFAEDPNTDGEYPLDNNNISLNRGIRGLIFSKHYASIFRQLKLPLLATALELGFNVPENIRFRVGIWRGLVPPMLNHEFIGGYFLPTFSPEQQFFYLNPSIYNDFSNFIDVPINPQLNLSLPGFTFFGLQRDIFDRLRRITIHGTESWEESILYQYENHESEYPRGLSILRDGSVLAPLDYFQFIDTIEI